MQDLKEIFYTFASFGNRRISKEEGLCEMDGARFAKLAKDCKLLDKKFTATDVDLTFSKARSAYSHPFQPPRSSAARRVNNIWGDARVE